MRKFITLIIIVVLSVGFYFFFQYRASEFLENDHKKKIADNLALLERDPDNCKLMADIANNYQAIYILDKAIFFYEQSLLSCPDDIHNRFQLGICYYLTMNREQGIEHMDVAIRRAKIINDNIRYKMLKDEKKAWLKKWDSVKELEWNTGMLGVAH